MYNVYGRCVGFGGVIVHSTTCTWQSLQWLSFFRLACGSSSSESETRDCMYVLTHRSNVILVH